MAEKFTLSGGSKDLTLKNDETGEEIRLIQAYSKDANSLNDLRTMNPQRSNFGEYEDQIANASFSSGALAQLSNDFPIEQYQGVEGFDASAGIVVRYAHDVTVAVASYAVHLTDENGDGQWEARLITPQYEIDNRDLLVKAESQFDTGSASKAELSTSSPVATAGAALSVLETAAIDLEIGMAVEVGPFEGAPLWNVGFRDYDDSGVLVDPTNGNAYNILQLHDGPIVTEENYGSETVSLRGDISIQAVQNNSMVELSINSPDGSAHSHTLRPQEAEHLLNSHSDPNAHLLARAIADFDWQPQQPSTNVNLGQGMAAAPSAAPINNTSAQTFATGERPTEITRTPIPSVARTFPAQDDSPSITHEPIPPSPQPDDQPLSGILARSNEIDGPHDYLHDLNSEQVKEMQRALGVDDDGLWGEKTMAAAEDYFQQHDLDPQATTLEQLAAHIENGAQTSPQVASVSDVDRSPFNLDQQKMAPIEFAIAAHGNGTPAAAYDENGNNIMSIGDKPASDAYNLYVHADPSVVREVAINLTQQNNQELDTEITNPNSVYQPGMNIA